MSSELSYNARAAGEKLQYSIAVYYIEGENLISTVIREGRPLNVNSDRVENSGFELNVKYSHNNELSFRGNYSYLYMKYPVLSAPENKFLPDWILVPESLQAVWEFSILAAYIRMLTMDSKKSICC